MPRGSVACHTYTALLDVQEATDAASPAQTSITNSRWLTVLASPQSTGHTEVSGLCRQGQPVVLTSPGAERHTSVARQRCLSGAKGPSGLRSSNSKAGMGTRAPPCAGLQGGLGRGRTAALDRRMRSPPPEKVPTRALRPPVESQRRVFAVDPCVPGSHTLDPTNMDRNT